MERVDLGCCEVILHERDPGRVAVLLPGHFYPTRAPALWFAREAAMARGWTALEVLGTPSEHEDPLAWESACAERALEAADAERVLVIGKSMASLLAGAVADRALPAVWLTPLLTESAVIDGLARAQQPTLLVGGAPIRAGVPKPSPPTTHLNYSSCPAATTPSRFRAIRRRP